jgi:hypothetical protein
VIARIIQQRPDIVVIGPFADLSEGVDSWQCVPFESFSRVSDLWHCKGVLNGVQEGIESGTLPRPAGAIAFHHRWSIAGRTKPNKELRQRLGGKQLFPVILFRDYPAKQLPVTPFIT